MASGEWGDGSGLEMYETPARSYDAQIGRFGQTDPLMEQTGNVSDYAFVLNNPVSMIDPSGALTEEAWQDFLNRLGDGSSLAGFGEHGGYYTSTSTTLTSFGSDGEAFGAGSAYMDQFNLWGTNGFAGSLDDAKNNYYSGGAMDGGRTVGGDNYGGSVQGVLPSVIVTATRQAGGRLSFGDAVWNWGNTMGSGSEEGSNEEMSGWKKAGLLSEATAFILDITEQGVVGAQRLANSVSGLAPEILEGGNVLKGIGVGLVGVSALFTVANAESKYGHLRTSDKVDLGIDAALVGTEVITTILTVSNPVGWIIGGSLFIGNLISEHYYNESLTEHFFN